MDSETWPSPFFSSSNVEIYSLIDSVFASSSCALDSASAPLSSAFRVSYSTSSSPATNVLTGGLSYFSLYSSVLDFSSSGFSVGDEKLRSSGDKLSSYDSSSSSL